MSATGQPSEEELRAAYEAEIKKIRVEQILLEQVVSIVNLGMRRTGLAPGTEDERDIDQLRLAIEAVRALLPLLERSAPTQAGQIRDALSQLQLAFVRLGGSPGAQGEQPSGAAEPGAAEPGAAEPGAAGPEGPAAPAAAGAGPAPGAAGTGPAPGPQGPGQPPGEEPKPGEGGPAQRSGRLWVPGQ
jgi:hypothetical protein